MYNFCLRAQNLHERKLPDPQNEQRWLQNGPQDDPKAVSSRPCRSHFLLKKRVENVRQICLTFRSLKMSQVGSKMAPKMAPMLSPDGLQELPRGYRGLKLPSVASQTLKMSQDGSKMAPKMAPRLSPDGL